MFTPSRPPADPGMIDPAEAVAQVASGDLTLIDVRDPAEWQMTGTARGALKIPMVALQMQVDPRSPECNPALDPDRPVALYCASGARSQMAAQMMAQMGYTKVYNLGGLRDWAFAGGEIV
ncbi:MAG: Rhodanese-related sulfurtransferase [Rhodobacteraceae bacterium HLUCCA08]|nr:MAG: Rhodanese-related sulfurtransferase [Rhodobacteraceae bacterium HLUCCA08]